MAGTRFTPDKAGMRALFASDMMADAMLDAADDLAGAIAADMRTSGRRRAGRTNYAPKATPRPSAGGTGRTDDGTVFAAVNANDPGWHLLEYGTSTTSPSRHFYHGVQAAGLRWEDNGP